MTERAPLHSYILGAATACVPLWLCAKQLRAMYSERFNNQLFFICWPGGPTSYFFCVMASDKTKKQANKQTKMRAKKRAKKQTKKQDEEADDEVRRTKKPVLRRRAKQAKKYFLPYLPCQAMFRLFGQLFRCGILFVVCG